MKNLQSAIKLFAVILKYSAVLIAVIKGIEIVNEELQKITFEEPKKV
jgi:hypothetical protein